MTTTLATTGKNTIQCEIIVGSAWLNLATAMAAQHAAVTLPANQLRIVVTAPRTGNTKNGANTNDVFVCFAPAPPGSAPSVPDGGWAISSDGTRDKMFHVDNPATVWFFGQHSGDAVEISIEV